MPVLRLIQRYCQWLDKWLDAVEEEFGPFSGMNDVAVFVLVFLHGFSIVIFIVVLLGLIITG